MLYRKVAYISLGGTLARFSCFRKYRSVAAFLHIDSTCAFHLRLSETTTPNSFADETAVCLPKRKLGITSATWSKTTPEVIYTLPWADCHCSIAAAVEGFIKLLSTGHHSFMGFTNVVILFTTCLWRVYWSTKSSSCIPETKHSGDYIHGYRHHIIEQLMGDSIYGYPSLLSHTSPQS